MDVDWLLWLNFFIHRCKSVKRWIKFPFKPISILFHLWRSFRINPRGWLCFPLSLMVWPVFIKVITIRFLFWSGFQMTVEKPKPKQSLRPITTGTNSAMNQSQFLAITCNSLEAREKSRVRGAIGFGFASHWLKNWCDSFKPITISVAIARTKTGFKIWRECEWHDWVPDKKNGTQRKLTVNW